MNYTETINYLYTKLPMFERQGPSGIKKDLTNTIALCSNLDHPEKKFKSIHIAGTNGKGSVSHMLAAIFQEAGYKTGLYVSPHYKDFRERIRVNGEYISQKYVVDFVESSQSTIQDIKPSFFEITVAMAFKYFADKKVDIAIIETGLGGRLDSTNVITPILSIITNISYDHQNILGNTLPEIAGEKAGIIKENIPVLIGEYQKEVSTVFNQMAKEQNSPIRYASKIGKMMTQATKDRYLYKSNEGQYLKLDMPYHGPYQEMNIKTVLQAIHWLNELQETNITDQVLNKGLKNLDKYVPLIGRFQIINKKPLTILDGAHNTGGLKLLFDKIKSIGKKKVHCVFGTVKDKEYASVIKILPKEFFYYFVKADLPRALDDVTLTQLASKKKLTGKNYGRVKNGYLQAIKNAKPNDLVLVTGSIFVVGELV